MRYLWTSIWIVMVVVIVSLRLVAWWRDDTRYQWATYGAMMLLSFLLVLYWLLPQ